MIAINLKAKVKEIRFSGEKSCVFVVEDEDQSELVCTITRNNIELAELVREGQEVAIKGNLAAYRRVKADRDYIENVIYITTLKVEDEVSEK